MIFTRMSFFTIVFTLFITFDSLGNIPVFVALLRGFDMRRQRIIIFRELLFALILVVLFCFFGDEILNMLNLTIPIVQIAGGILLFIIALSMLFPKAEGETEVLVQEPFIVPLATPILAGPATLSTVMVFASQVDSSCRMLLAITIAWIPTLIILLLSSFLKKLLGDKVLLAFERLAGLILTYIAIQMFVVGVHEYSLLVLHGP